MGSKYGQGQTKQNRTEQNIKWTTTKIQKKPTTKKPQEYQNPSKHQKHIRERASAGNIQTTLDTVKH